MNDTDLRPNFGLGDAAIAEIVRIEWPSGIVQEIQNVAANQTLTLTEPSKLEPVLVLRNGLVGLEVKSWKGFVYTIEASSDLVHWTGLTALTNLTRTLQFTDPAVANSTRSFYRLRH